MKTILVPTDFTSSAKQGIDYALLLGRQFDSQIILLNVWSLPQTHPTMIISMGDIINENSEKAIVKLKNELIQDPKNKNLAFKTIVKMGDIVPLIKNVAAKNNADLIVMATEGAAGLKEVFIGSNAGGVIEEAPCPVIVIPHNSPVTTPQKIAVATNFEDSDFKVLKKVQQLFSGFGCTFSIFHVGDPEYKDLNQYEDFCVEINKKHPEITTNYLSDDDVSDGIEKYISKNNIDLIVLSAHKHTVLQLLFNRSVSKRIVYHSHIPLMVFQIENGSLEQEAMLEEEEMHS